MHCWAASQIVYAQKSMMVIFHHVFRVGFTAPWPVSLLRI